MAARKGAKKRGGGKGKIFRVLLLLGLLAATLVAAFVLLILRPYENQHRAAAKIVKAKAPVMHYEEGDAGPNLAPPLLASNKGGATLPASSQPVAKRREGELPLLAIVIDDMGYQTGLDEELLRLGLNLTFAFLPHGPHTAGQAELARQLGHEVLLHFPMEPDDPRWNPGPGAATIGMSRAQLRTTFAENLALVPQALGINNHMGSRFTSDPGAMRDFLALVRERRLFFLDSFTSQTSVGYSLAREMGVKACRRQVFLDNVKDEAKIIDQLRQLLAVAERQGGAVGIGHPYPQTLAALRAAGPEILARTRLVAVSRLIQ
ncbi:MAG: divergent polysaccharide deacetylase family protein [Desulfobulbaceae bacterium]|nr:divergent polysaccharide deacetylase family protein [Desulfobulbaceae bacterium]